MQLMLELKSKLHLEANISDHPIWSRASVSFHAHEFHHSIGREREINREETEREAVNEVHRRSK